jgi:hypothetical protein
MGLSIQVVCHPEAANLFGGRRITAVSPETLSRTINYRDASLRSA